jgi:hypothetical protein
MSSQLVIIGGILHQNLAQVRFAEDNHMVDALASDRSDQPFGEAVLPRRAWGDGLVADAHGAQSVRDGSAIDAIASMAMSLSGGFEQWGYGIGRSRHGRHGKTDIRRG